MNNLISNAENDEELFLEDINLSKQQEERAKQISFRIKPKSEQNFLIEKQSLKEEKQNNSEFGKQPKLDDKQGDKSGQIDEKPSLEKVEDNCNHATEQKDACLQKVICLEDAINQGKSLIKEIHLQIADIYKEHFANSAFAYSLNEVANDLERYLQALLLLSCSTNKKLSEEEMNFIWAVLSRANVFEGSSSFEESLDKAKILTRVNPHALLLTVAVDKFYKKDQTTKLLTKVYDLYLLSCSLKNTKIIDKKQLLEAQYNFALAQGVNIND